MERQQGAETYADADEGDDEGCNQAVLGRRELGVGVCESET